MGFDTDESVAQPINRDTSFRINRCPTGERVQVSSPEAVRSGAVTVCLPDLPERQLMGALPANVEVLLIPPEPAPLPDLSRVDLIVPNGRVRPALLEAIATPGRLRVIQTLSAGVDWLIGRVPESVTVCNARGAYDGPLAEWVVGAILVFQRGIVRARDAQQDGSWTSFEPDELAGHRVVILGYGSIGSAVADRLRPFGVEVTGIARTRREDALGFEDIDAVLPLAEVLVNLLPLTTETAGFMDARRLALLPDGALLVNAGRGRTVDTTALLGELESGRLRAALDVTDPEPLPAGHPLWALPNVLISPHIAGDSPESTARAFALAGDQIRRFARGEPLINEVARYLLA
jgi:phosphoglycerate dehydrogenase-like enzyme